MSDELDTKGETGQEAVTSAAIEGDNSHISAVIQERMANADKPVTTEMIVNTLKRIESAVRKNYPDPTRVTVEGSNPHRMVIHQDFRRDLPPIPKHVRSPQIALDFGGTPILVSTVTVPEVKNRDGVVVRRAYDLPVYAAADADGKPWRDADGKPWRDARGEYVLIDPQTGQIRQNMKPTLVKRRGRSWLRVKLIQLKQWWRSIHFDFKFIKRS